MIASMSLSLDPAGDEADKLVRPRLPSHLGENQVLFSRLGPDRVRISNVIKRNERASAKLPSGRSLPFTGLHPY